MSTEVAEIPQAAARLLQDGRKAIAQVAAAIDLGRVSHAVVSGRGSSGHAGTYLRYLIETRLGLSAAPAAPSVVTRYGASPRLGEALYALLPPGTVVALHGDLAAGKTCLVRGMARLGADEEPVHSPTFTLVNEYGTGKKIYHLDLYRLSGPDELADIGYEELFDGDGICVIEWAERAKTLLPKQHIAIHLEHAGGDRRRILIESNGLLPEDWRKRLA